MEPKAYSASPVGANFLVVSGSWSAGNVLFDPTVPITDVHADVRGLVAGTGHTFNLFGKLALATVGVPLATVRASGNVFDAPHDVTRSGLADMRLKISVNLRGNPAMSPREFAQAPRRMVIGASLSASAPIGQYVGTHLINIGNNRWAFKPEVGISWPKGHWDIDAYVGGWIFMNNDDYFPGGAQRKQASVVGIQAHASYTVRRGLWIAGDGTWYRGGSARVNDGSPTTPQRNARVGVTASLPLSARQSVKIAYGRGAIVRTGTDFRTIAVAWQMVWLTR